MSEISNTPRRSQPKASGPTGATAQQQGAVANTQRGILKEQVARVLKETGFELTPASRILGLSEPQLILAIRQLFAPGI